MPPHVVSGQENGVFQEMPFIEPVSHQNGVIQVCLKKEGSLGAMVEQIDLKDLKTINSR